MPAGRAEHGDEELRPGGAGCQQPLQDEALLDQGEGPSLSFHLYSRWHLTLKLIIIIIIIVIIVNRLII